MQALELSEDPIDALARMLFIHYIAEGQPLDVTVEHPTLQPLLQWGEKEQLIEIDVKKAAWKLTTKGLRMHEQQLEEAQDLIRRYDIFGDVDIDESGNAHFDAQLGKDLRAPIWELEGIDPYRARFIIGLNDGEWNDEDLAKIAFDDDWYHQVMAPIDNSPAIEDIGRTQLQSVLEQGKAKLRREGARVEAPADYD